ncbi:MAG: peptide chain release factor H [Sideroxyarcus sp.]|nr:peptide chain release factor H [Sideroxyarcus sp.]
MMLLLQISAAQGPAECQLAVAKALRRLLVEATDYAVELQVVEEEPGAHAGTFRSVLLALEGARADELARSWEGTVQWSCPSPYRPNHGRQNWFIGVARFAAPTAILEGEIRFETMRSSGPGGQHVNTTDSAVRATHVSTGISVKVQTERSQHANKRLAVLLIARRLAQRSEEAKLEQRADRRMAHHQVARGDPVRVFRGDNFKPGS